MMHEYRSSEEELSPEPEREVVAADPDQGGAANITLDTSVADTTVLGLRNREVTAKVKTDTTKSQGRNTRKRSTLEEHIKELDMKLKRTKHD